MLMSEYQRLKDQVVRNYASNDSFRRLLINKIEFLKSLEEEYSDKESIKHAFSILDDISRKDFTHINSKFVELQKTASVDTRNFSFLKSIISLMLLPILLPLLVLESLVVIVAAYQYMIYAQIALLALAVTLTLLFLQPLMLLATIPTTLVLGHLLSEFVLDKVIEQIIYDVGTVLESLFYEEDKKLKDSLDDIMSTAKQARNHVEGSAVRRFFSDTSLGFFNLFGYGNSELKELHVADERMDNFGRS